jgi:hypothetical protein
MPKSQPSRSGHNLALFFPPLFAANGGQHANQAGA